jgi:Flp pilus assembly pilin Flp
MWTALGNVKISDFWRGLIVAIIAVPLTIIYDSAMTGSLTFDWKKIVAAAIVGGVAYIVKNLDKGADGNILTNK